MPYQRPLPSSIKYFELFFLCKCHRDCRLHSERERERERDRERERERERERKAV